MSIQCKRYNFYDNNSTKEARVNKSQIRAKFYTIEIKLVSCQGGFL